MTEKLICSIGVLAYNEAKNIAKLLDSLLNQKLSRVEIKEIIVVSSASTDGTDEIVREYEKKDSRISLIAESERNGKSAAINHFIAHSHSDLLIIESADTIPGPETVEKMIVPFKNKKIGMTGGRPMPVNRDDQMIGFAVQLLWKLHHKMAIRQAKLGEMVAFRKVFDEIPVFSAVDEASIEAIIREQGYQLLYVSDAPIYNKGPENISDFIKQRRRIEAGHLWLKDHQNYQVSSQNPLMMIYLLVSAMFEDPKNIHKIIFTAKLEVFCRILGWYDYKIKKKNPFKWSVISSSKDLDKK